MFGIQTAFEETQTYKDLLAIGHEKGLAEGRRAEAADLLLRLEALADPIFDLDSPAALENWLSRS